MTSSHFSNVAIELNSAQAALFHDIARLLKSEHGARIHCYVRTSREVDGLRRRHAEPPWDSINCADPVGDAIRESGLDDDIVIAEACRFEALTGWTINQLLAAHRQLNRGFSVGGFDYPRGRRYLEAGYVQQVHAIVAALRFWDGEIEAKQLSLIIDGPVEAAVLAAAYGIAYRRLHVARYGNYQFWAPDLRQSNPGLLDAYARIADAPEVEMVATYGSAKSKIDHYMRSFSLLRIARTLPVNAAWHLCRNIQGGGEAARKPGLGRILAAPFKNWARFKALMRMASATLDDLGHTPFVYFPLHKEPEIALNQAAPEVASQQAAIIDVSRELPAGVRLAVKEHVVSIRNRPRGFYEQIAALPNVVLLNPFESSIGAIKAAKATVVIFGTAGLESALLGRPTISLARSVPWGVMRHVRIAQDVDALRAALDDALAGRFDEARARRDGGRFLEAIKTSCFDMGEFRVVRTEGRGATPELARIAYDGLVESVRRYGAWTGDALAPKAAAGE